MTAEKNKTIKAMSKLLYTIFTIGMLCTLQGRADHHIKKSTVKDFEEFSKILEGRWLVDIVFITDWPGLDRKKGDKIIGVGQGDDGDFEDIIGWRLDDVVTKIQNATTGEPKGMDGMRTTRNQHS